MIPTMHMYRNETSKQANSISELIIVRPKNDWSISLLMKTKFNCVLYDAMRSSRYETHKYLYHLEMRSIHWFVEIGIIAV